jgi:hypothetical protein
MKDCGHILRAATLSFAAFIHSTPLAAQASGAGDSVQPPEVQCDTSADGFCDISLAVEQQTTEPDGSLLLTALGKHKSDTLGLRVLIAPGMRPGAMNPLTGGPQVYSLQRGGVRFESAGQSSDLFLARLAQLYHTRSRPKTMASDTHFTAFAFHGDPYKIDSREVLFELYHDDPANQVPQCVVLFDVNLPGKQVRIREKDQDFRDCIIRILGESE